MNNEEIIAKLTETTKLAQFNLDDDYQKCILGLIVADRQFLMENVDLIQPTYFKNDSHKLICRLVFDYYEEYKKIPNKIILKQAIRDRIKDEVKILITNAELSSLYDYYIPGLDARESLQNRVLKFAKTQALRVAFRKSFDLLTKDFESDETWVEINEIYREAILVDRKHDLGLNYFETLEDRYERMTTEVINAERFTSGFETIDNSLTGGGMRRGEIYSWMGMCFAKNTLILMYDGTNKKVQDVKIGDLVMGDDSTPRKVMKLSKGIDELYKVQPVKGDSYVVNGNHILTLKNSHKTKLKRSDRKGKRYSIQLSKHYSKVEGSNIYNISVNDWFNQSNHFKKSMKGYRVGVDFSHKEVKINPYYLGVWLGDGTRNCPSITNIDAEVIDEIKKEAERRNLKVREYNLSYSIFSEKNSKKPPGKSLSDNSLFEDLKYYNLIHSYRNKNSTGSKHIPFDYKTNDRNVRLELLAGLMDSDGSESNSGYDFINKNKTLANDVLFLARSLGFAAYMKECEKKCQNGFVGKYWRINISGDCSEIPVRIPRKKCSKRKQIKDHLVTGVTVEPKGVGEYYGFEVDGNHMFLLSDFTVVHNSGTGKSLALVTAAVKNLVVDKKVLYISCEMSRDEIAERFDAQFANEAIGMIYERKDVVISAIKEHVAGLEDKRQLVITDFPSGSADVNQFRSHIAQLKMSGFIPDVVIVDYIGEMKDAPGVQTYESRFRIVRDLKGFAKEEGFLCLTAMQPNRSARELQEDATKYIDDSNLADAFGQTRPLNGLWSINQGLKEKKANVARGFIVKSRRGKSRIEFLICYDERTLRMSEITKDVYRNRMSLVTQADVDKTGEHFNEV